MTRTKPKPKPKSKRLKLITDRRREMIVETMNKPYPTGGNLAWVHWILAVAMKQHGIKPLPIRRRR